MNKIIGILGMQGAIAEHQEILLQIPHTKTRIVKTAKDLDCIDGLILPGGESTAIGKLLDYFSLKEILQQKIISGLPVFGTCAGLILLAKNIENQTNTHLATMDITVKRNGYGSQLDSFSTNLLIPTIDKNMPIPLVFIRAPYITKTSKDVQILATLDNKIIAARQKNMLVSSFHPELTNDLRFHQYFLSMI
ncbi:MULTISPECIES: pyridoxal 5'-phosphate synthase glutaminase subunit PdxT [Megamonas]|jgi:5'-phosphate synthase pdxT subunit|uniref:pyridoxal 5'-phosphate synthase glutaminase subunit PdxT n=1 Tax=Megamonas TaxID=158846 RepID=UPI00037EF266|nr:MULTISPECIES: pyridoxal 5'-phosphate synthase glutaminase subunit PdxT [Megamonas]BDA10962.1 pyridoxal 5'-phosphate synthase subunit PdxT [Megamonas funiformis]